MTNALDGERIHLCATCGHRAGLHGSSSCGHDEPPCRCRKYVIRKKQPAQPVDKSDAAGLYHDRIHEEGPGRAARSVKVPVDKADADTCICGRPEEDDLHDCICDAHPFVSKKEHAETEQLRASNARLMERLRTISGLLIRAKVFIHIQGLSYPDWAAKVDALFAQAEAIEQSKLLEALADQIGGFHMLVASLSQQLKVARDALETLRSGNCENYTDSDCACCRMTKSIAREALARMTAASGEAGES